MLGNPELFDIETLKSLNMWPSETLVSRGIIPYLKRLKQDKIAIAIIGDLKGENAVDIVTNVPKVVKVSLHNDYSDNTDAEELKSVLSKNIKDHKSIIDPSFSKKERDVICFDKSSCTLDNLKLYYDYVKSGGIVCGNGHEFDDVKIALTQFRRECRIGTQMQISHLTTWFWYKR